MRPPANLKTEVQRALIYHLDPQLHGEWAPLRVVIQHGYGMTVINCRAWPGSLTYGPFEDGKEPMLLEQLGFLGRLRLWWLIRMEWRKRLRAVRKS